MLAWALLLAAAPRTGTVRLHLTDARNRPIPRHEIWLDATSSTKPVRPFGVQWFIPGGSYHGTTNANGDVAIPGVPVRKPMMVVTRFGPRFDAFVAKNGNPSGASLDVIKFDGAVYAGRKAHVILAEDREISGVVTDASGKPLKGIAVTLSDTGFGHMGGYPGTTLDEQKTDERGAYRFARLPNCDFLLFADAPPHTAVESRVDKGSRNLIAVIGQTWSSEAVSTEKPKSVCDFRIIRTATLTAIFKGAPSEFKGWTAWVYSGKQGLCGRDLDYGAKSTTVTSETLPGPVTVWISRDRGEIWWVARKLTLEPGETRTVEISMAEVLKRRQRR